MAAVVEMAAVAVASEELPKLVKDNCMLQGMVVMKEVVKAK